MNAESLERTLEAQQTKEKNESREEALKALKAGSDRDLMDQINRLQALPMNKRTHFLRVRRPGGGSHL